MFNYKNKSEIFTLENGIKRASLLTQTLLRRKSTIIIGLTGGSAAGKGFVADLLCASLKGSILTVDDYYRGLSHMCHDNFDHPDALELGLLAHHLRIIRQGKPVQKPIYDFSSHERLGSISFQSNTILIVEGLYALHISLLPLLDIKIYVHASEKTRLKRRIDRDTKERGRSKSSIVEQWQRTVLPMHRKYVAVQKSDSDLIIRNE